MSLTARLSVVGLESAAGLKSDTSPHSCDSDLDSDTKESDFAHKTKVKAIHEVLINY